MFPACYIGRRVCGERLSTLTAHEALRPAGLSIVRPESHVCVVFCPKKHRVRVLTQKSVRRNKAVSDGAISFYLDHFVRTRVSKFAYGTFCDTLYRPEEHDHRVRVSTLYTDFAGTKRIPDNFDIILPKVLVVRNIILHHTSMGTDNQLAWHRISKSPRRKSSKAIFWNT